MVRSYFMYMLHRAARSASVARYKIYDNMYYITMCKRLSHYSCTQLLYTIFSFDTYVLGNTLVCVLPITLDLD